MCDRCWSSRPFLRTPSWRLRCLLWEVVLLGRRDGAGDEGWTWDRLCGPDGHHGWRRRCWRHHRVEPWWVQLRKHVSNHLLFVFITWPTPVCAWAAQSTGLNHIVRSTTVAGMNRALPRCWLGINPHAWGKDHACLTCTGPERGYTHPCNAVALPLLWRQGRHQIIQRRIDAMCTSDRLCGCYWRWWNRCLNWNWGWH